MILLRNCCFFYSLRTGCIVIGVIQSVFSLITLICAAVTVNSDINHGKNSKSKNKDLNLLQNSAWLLFIFSAGTISIMASMLLIMGTKNKKPKYLRFWLIFMAVVILSSVLYSLLRPFTPETMLMDALPIAFLVYFWIVVLSYYFETSQRNDVVESQVLFTNSETLV